jgi:hypothetical protein
MARKVGLKINRAKTEFKMVGNWASPIEFRVSTGTINLVKDFKYLGCWLLNFEIRKASTDLPIRELLLFMGSQQISQ